MRRFSLIITLIACFLPGLAVAQDETVTVVSWGGAYEAAQKRALFKPFTEATGIAVDVKSYNGGLDGFDGRAVREGWDVADMIESDAISACDAGLLHPLNHPDLIGGDHEAEDFAPKPLRDCSIPHLVFATVLAYNDHAFPGIKPSRVEDFFDLDRFPGKRAVEKRPAAILEWALMAEGVPPSQVYDLLSTHRGLRLAFRKLDSIREAIVWWEDAATPAEMLRRGEVAMASGYNGRFFSASRQGAKIAVIWDGRLIDYDVWAVPATADLDKPVKAFLRFVTRPAAMARLATEIPYGPARRSAFERIGLHPEYDIPMRDHLPNAERPTQRSLLRDSNWYARTHRLRSRRFEDWLEADNSG